MAYVVTLTSDEIALLHEALDAYHYWQLAPFERRRDGYVVEPMGGYPEDEQAAVDLDIKLTTATERVGAPDAL